MSNEKIVMMEMETRRQWDDDDLEQHSSVCSIVSAKKQLAQNMQNNHSVVHINSSLVFLLRTPIHNILTYYTYLSNYTS